ncbi:cytidine deaminase [Microbulbifer mangrovi]|uniref:cytidine deaminase n=1 Tax=Microbulbifer mangrovi TaxID=927787 RepID=UPI0013015665|nr:cytidine deaminase [Microbulbifer mangrovi]
MLEAALTSFPKTLRTELEQVAVRGGKVHPDLVQHLCRVLNIDVDALMLRLVPLAAAYGVAPVSHFSVGAVARGQRLDSNGYAALYLGANMEFPGRALCFSLHAEQAAVANAWNNRESGITSLAVSAVPCGHCRQFLYELSESSPLRIVFPDGTRHGYRQTDIAELLPGAFGPADLGHEGNMMAVNIAADPPPLEIEQNASVDALVREALKAARFSYAPYTRNHAGCAVQLQNGRIFSGSYAENAAHNPGLSPLHAALSNMRMALGPASGPEDLQKVARCVLVEKAADISQRELVTTLISSFAPQIALEYYVAE